MRKTHLIRQKRVTPQEAMDAAIHAFYQRCEARNLSPHSISYYRYRFNAFTKFLADHDLQVAPEDVTPAMVRDFLASERVRISALTARHSFVTLRCFYSFLVKEGLVSENPMEKVQPVKQTRKVMTTFDSDGLQAILNTAGNDFAGVRLRTMLLVLADTGIRVSELCGIKLSDVSLDEQTLKVLGKGDKERLVAFGRASRTALQAYMARRYGVVNHDRLFITVYGEPLTRLRAYRLLVEAGEKAGVSGVTPHNFRRFFAREFIRAGGDCFVLQRALGHTSLEMSRRYCELASVDVLAAQRRFSPGDALPKPLRGGRKQIK